MYREGLLRIMEQPLWIRCWATNPSPNLPHSLTSVYPSRFYSCVSHVVLSHKTVCAFLTSTTPAACPAHFTRFLFNPNNKYWTVRNTQLGITKFSPSVRRLSHTFQYPAATRFHGLITLSLTVRNEVYGHTRSSGVHKDRDDTSVVYSSDT